MIVSAVSGESNGGGDCKGEDSSAASSADTDAKCGGLGGEGEDVEMRAAAGNGSGKMCFQFPG